jgi:hypothetical protein
VSPVLIASTDAVALKKEFVLLLPMRSLHHSACGSAVPGVGLGSVCGISAGPGCGTSGCCEGVGRSGGAGGVGSGEVGVACCMVVSLLLVGFRKKLLAVIRSKGLFK